MAAPTWLRARPFLSVVCECHVGDNARYAPCTAPSKSWMWGKNMDITKLTLLLTLLKPPRLLWVLGFCTQTRRLGCLCYWGWVLRANVCPSRLSFLVFLRYQCYYGYPLLTYLEVPILIAQDVILLLCVFHFNGNVKQAAPYLAVFFSSWFVLTLQKWIIDLAMNLCTFISAASKFAQLQYLWKTRDSGAVSALTWSLASYTCATRIVTTLMTTNDLTILTRFVIMLALNIWVTATILHYRKKTTMKTE
ncbi:solute carrier family 66 member 3 isoform X3 [Choloepus didactylus]|uniref:solute carrier family 66 member 3 isoform X3 n=1 Tax=Choloepus didactylus TaxID=27675 RepID=UPI00189F5B45|nr:solute carrier family 66 member 3 isoform X3 [Choloepus didactylus]